MGELRPANMAGHAVGTCVKIRQLGEHPVPESDSVGRVRSRKDDLRA